MSETLQYYEQERKLRRETGEVIEAHHRVPDGKLIAIVQICYHCNRQFASTENADTAQRATAF